MDYHHRIDQSQEYARKAIALMAQHGIAAHPNNFAVWYCHCSGEWPELSGTLNALVAGGHGVSEDRSAAVFRAFCASPYDALPLHLLAEKIEGELVVVVGALEQAGRGTREYSKSLVAAATEVAAQPTAAAVRGIIGQMLCETRALVTQSRELDQRLQASLTEISSLKSELEGARREALSDALTGLANRRMLENALREAAALAAETNDPLSLMLIDIDHFKKFNDDFGHLVGDHVLKLLAVVLRENVKGRDTAARYGGEEFAVLLPQTKAADARKLAESIRLNIAGRKLFNRKTGEPLSQVTVSIGIAQFRERETLLQFLERADQALYLAKRVGRNRVIVQEDTYAGLVTA